jgi:hypothetical protein
MKLPNAERALVDLRKLRDYCLNPEHPRGQHKARLFQSALGWTIDHAEEVRQTLLRSARSEEAVFLSRDDYGQRYAVDFSIQSDRGVATVRSLWMVRAGEDFPRLTTCYVL